MKKCPVSRHVQGPALHIRSHMPRFVEKVWGGRRIERLFGEKLPKGRRIGECWLYHGNVVIKLIDVRKPLSVQVHPSGKNGKSELWYIIEAGKSTRVLGGITLDEYRVKTGDWIYIPGGTVHTILPPAVLLEVSQPNLITYRLYDWGRGTRPLDIEKGLRVLDINAKPKIYRNINSFRCPYFSVKLLKGEGGGFKRAEAFLSKGTVYALINTDVFSVNWITKSSRRRRCGSV